MLSSKIQRDFWNSIGKAAEDAATGLQKDTTITGTINSIIDANTGEYQIEYQGALLIAHSQSSDIGYKVGDQVLILVPQGDFTMPKIIQGVVYRKSVEESDSFYDSLYNLTVDNGANWTEIYHIDKDSRLSICAIPEINIDDLDGKNLNYSHYLFLRDDNGTGQSQELPSRTNHYRSTENSQYFPNSADLQLEQLSATSDLIKISAKFFTNFYGTHQNGSYSLQVDCLTYSADYFAYLQSDEKNTKEFTGEKYEVVSYSLGFNNFVGASPYNFRNNLEQSAYFELPNAPICGLKAISLVQDGRMELDAKTTYESGKEQQVPEFTHNIQASDISIKFMNKVHLEDELYYAATETPSGTSFYSSQSGVQGKNSIDLIPHLYFNGNDLINDELCEVHWFRQKADITSTSQSSADKKDAHNNFFTYYGGDGWYPIENIIRDYEAAGYENMYYHLDNKKLTILEAAVPYKFKYKVVITYYKEQKASTNGVSYTEVCKVYDIKEVINRNSPYDLSIQADDKGVLSIQGTFNQQPINNWLGTWYKDNGNNSYTLCTTNTDAYIKTNKLLNSQDFVRNIGTNFYIQVYDPKINLTPDNLIVQQSPFDEIAVLEYYQGAAEEGDIVIEWDGLDTFNYDAQGSADNAITQNEHVIQPIIRFKDNTVTTYNLIVFGPDGARITSQMSTYFPKNSMLGNIWIDRNNAIHFHINSSYDPTATQNSFTAVLTLGTGKQYKTFKAINFSKDGEQGTIGNEWKVEVYPCSSTNDNYLNKVFTEKIYSPMPLIVDINSQGEYTQRNGTHLYLKPFVTKQGKLLDNLDPYEAYYYKVYWDVRMPGSSSESIKYSSFLRLCHADTGNEFTTNTNAQWETGTDYTKIQYNINEQHRNGLVGFTGYPIDPIDSTYRKPDVRGAVEVKFFDNKNQSTGASLEDCQYRFIVKCQVDIFRGSYSLETGTIIPAGDKEKVASLCAYYPVDVMFCTPNTASSIRDIANAKEVRAFGEKVRTNWTRYVVYDSRGLHPTQMSEPLYFKYGEDIANYAPKNFTGQVQRITTTTSQGYSQYHYNASPHLNMAEGFHGTLMTYPNEGPTDFADGFYVRNQVMTLNLYGNIDISGWDGQGLDTNEKDGTIFGATFGAGYKIPNTNTFTGVLMGVDKSRVREDTSGSTLSVSVEQNKYMPYMTGIFGYQEGEQSFGFLENGTGFIGKNSGGGQIIFDGNNALIYGGGNGEVKSPSITDDMWNSMRLNLIDLTHATTDTTKTAAQYFYPSVDYDGEQKYRASQDDPGVKKYGGFVGLRGEDGNIELGFNGNFYGYDQNSQSDFSTKNYLPKWYKTIWENAYIKKDGATPYWMASKIADRDYNSLPSYGTSEAKEKDNVAINYFTQSFYTDKNGEMVKYIASERVNFENAVNTKGNIQLSSFGPNRASTTPAIEIGQHPHGLMPGLLPFTEYENVFKDLHIPGDRNFMVTYDGTMWAMNGIFMGSIIGSNIIGGRLQGSEIGIGKEVNGTIPTVTPDHEEIQTPLTEIAPWTTINRSFAVDPDGKVGMTSLAIAGGTIDIQHFHIARDGTLSQFAQSFFVGATNIIGDATVSGSMNISGPTTVTGTFEQIGSRIVLGNVSGESVVESITKIHKSSYFNIIGDSNDRAVGDFGPLHFYTERVAEPLYISWITTCPKTNNDRRHFNTSFFRVDNEGTKVQKLYLLDSKASLIDEDTLDTRSDDYSPCIYADKDGYVHIVSGYTDIKIIPS